jgi:hypothetical protein
VFAEIGEMGAVSNEYLDCMKTIGLVWLIIQVFLIGNTSFLREEIYLPRYLTTGFLPIRRSTSAGTFPPYKVYFDYYPLYYRKQASFLEYRVLGVAIDWSEASLSPQ